MSNKDAPSQNGIEIDWSLNQFSNYIPALIWASRHDGLCTYFNQNWLNFVGRSMAQEIGNGWAENVHPDDFDRCYEIYTRAVQQQQNFSMEYRLKRHDGKFRWILDKGITRYSESGEFLGFIGTCLDVTEQHTAKQIIEKQRDELAHIAMHDDLTNAFNRRYLFEYANLEIERCKRYGHQLHLLMIDIDDFKNINDTFGHYVGDETLKSLVKCFGKRVRSCDMVCRYAGDEFCIILPETNQQGAIEIAERIRAGANKIKLPKTNNLEITISIGIAKHNKISPGIKDWIQLADSALYKAKQEGKNRVHIIKFGPQIQPQAKD